MKVALSDVISTKIFLIVLPDWVCINISTVGPASAWALVKVNGATRKQYLVDELNLIGDPATEPIAGKSQYTFSIGSFMNLLQLLGTSSNVFVLEVIDSADVSTSVECKINIVE